MRSLVMAVSVLLMCVWVFCAGCSSDGTAAPDSPENDGDGIEDPNGIYMGIGGGLAFGKVEPHINFVKPFKLGVQYFIGLTEPGSQELLVSAYYAWGVPPSEVHEGDIWFLRMPVGLYDCVLFVFDDPSKPEEPIIVFRGASPIEVSVLDPHPSESYGFRPLGDGPLGSVTLNLTVLGDLAEGQSGSAFWGLIPVGEEESPPWFNWHAGLADLVWNRDNQDDPQHSNFADIPAGSYYFGLYQVTESMYYPPEEVYVYGETSQPIVLVEAEQSASADLTVDIANPVVRTFPSSD